MIIWWLVLRSSFRPAKGLIRDLSAWQTRWPSRHKSCSLTKWWVPCPGRNELRKTSHQITTSKCVVIAFIQRSWQIRNWPISENIPQLSKLLVLRKNVKDNIHNSLYSTQKYARIGYLSLDIICSSKLAVFLDLRSRKTVRLSEQIMSPDKYPSL